MEGIKQLHIQIKFVCFPTKSLNFLHKVSRVQYIVFSETTIDTKPSKEISSHSSNDRTRKFGDKR
jgi:hypothetical protein